MPDVEEYTSSLSKSIQNESEKGGYETMYLYSIHVRVIDSL